MKWENGFGVRVSETNERMKQESAMFLGFGMGSIAVLFFSVRFRSK